MKITKLAKSSFRRTAATPDQNKKKIESVEKELKDVKQKIKTLQSDIKKVTQSIDSLNIGSRRFWQQQTVFTSLQRKLERFEKVEEEWKKYKNDMDDKIKKEVEKKTRAQIGSLGPSM